MFHKMLIIYFHPNIITLYPTQCKNFHIIVSTFHLEHKIFGFKMLHEKALLCFGNPGVKDPRKIQNWEWNIANLRMESGTKEQEYSPQNGG